MDHGLPLNCPSPPHSFAYNDLSKQDIKCKVVEKVIRSEMFSIAFILGPKPNLNKVSVDWIQENKTN